VSEIVPEAYVDGLCIMSEAPASIVPMSVKEYHLYSYLGCVLALFKGAPIADWGYQFAITSEGFPFSAQLDEARRILCSSGLIETDDQGLMKAKPGELTDELETLLEVGSWSLRRMCLSTATECALALPIGSIRQAINRSPGVAPSFLLGQRKQLLEPVDTAQLYEEYKAINSILGANAEDLLSPAVIWLTARILGKDDLRE
jgi:hypothetical protein